MSNIFYINIFFKFNFQILIVTENMLVIILHILIRYVIISIDCYAVSIFYTQVEQVPPLKKQPSRCRRGLASRLAAKNKDTTEDNRSSEISEKSAVYSTQVSRMLSNRGIPNVKQFQCLLSGILELGRRWILLVM
jgi:hypothetical protein